MLTEEQKEAILRNEVSYQTSRAGGKGGQNVNKVESRVEIAFDVVNSQVLTPGQKQIILDKAVLVNESLIKKVASNHRTQLENKEEVQKKLIALLDRLLKPVKKRVATKPGKAAKQRKLDQKKRISEKKSTRSKKFPF